MTVVDLGDKVHVIRRRLFENDMRRHFFGQVERIERSVARLSGFVFLYDASAAGFVRRDDRRTTIIDLASPGFIVNVVDPRAEIGDCRYETNDHNHLVFTDGVDFALDINEFGMLR